MLTATEIESFGEHSPSLPETLWDDVLLAILEWPMRRNPDGSDTYYSNEGVAVTVRRSQGSVSGIEVSRH